MSDSGRWGEPWVVYEDDHVLAVSKPAGVNTHRADEFAQDGMYDWVRRQRPGVSLSIIHRLDKPTSGVLVFGKSTDANRALAAQFEERRVDKVYEFLTDRVRTPRGDPFRVEAPIDGAEAVTEFVVEETGDDHALVEARPHTGRTHQVRIHAQHAGSPIVGDHEYGGGPGARVFLHAARLRAEGPDGTMDLAVRRPPSFDRVLAGDEAGSVGTLVTCALEARRCLLDEADTDAFVWMDRHHDGVDGIRVERLGSVALVLDHRETVDPPTALIDELARADGVEAVYLQRRQRRGAAMAELVAGRASERSTVREIGVRYRVDLAASATSTGLFLDQRETRRELLRTDLTDATVLNTFAHTGSLSVAAALAGAETLTLDLSKRYLDWARDNLRINDLDPADHDFVYGDAMDWMDRFARKGRTFDVVIADPPSSSTPRKKGAPRWSVDRDLHALTERSARLCAGGGSVYVSTNYRKMSWPDFVGHLERGLAAAGRSGAIETRTLPLDHRSGAGDPPYLKGAWLRLDG